MSRLIMKQAQNPSFGYVMEKINKLKDHYIN